MEYTYYGILAFSSFLFAVQFLFGEIYRKEYGNGLKESLISTLCASVVGMVVLSAISGFSFGITPFSLLMSALAASTSLAFNFFTLKSLSKINLSLYSVFSMLGGMALPFAAGILFFGEALTKGKIVCFIFTAAALFLTVEKGKNKKSGGLYYAAIFILNGMFGVYNKIYKWADFAKVTDSQYAMLTATVSVVVAVAVLLIISRKEKPNKPNIKAISSACGVGLVNNIANFLLLICLTVLPASAQYPFITGGTMIFSTVLCFFTDKKPSKKELASVAFSFMGILMLVLMP